MIEKPELDDFIVCLPNLPLHVSVWTNTFTKVSGWSHYLFIERFEGKLLDQNAMITSSSEVRILSPCKGRIRYIAGEYWSRGVTKEKLLNGTFSDAETLIKIQPVCGYRRDFDYAQQAFREIIKYHDKNYKMGLLSKSFWFGSSNRGIAYFKIGDKTEFEAEEALYLEQIKWLRKAKTCIEAVKPASAYNEYGLEF